MTTTKTPPKTDLVRTEIGKIVKQIIMEKIGVDEEDVTDDANLANDVGADSLDQVELIMEFEKEFDIGIPDDEAEKIVTVGNVIKYIEENVPKK